MLLYVIWYFELGLYLMAKLSQDCQSVHDYGTSIFHYNYNASIKMQPTLTAAVSSRVYFPLMLQRFVA